MKKCCWLLLVVANSEMIMNLLGIFRRWKRGLPRKLFLSVFNRHLQYWDDRFGVPGGGVWFSRLPVCCCWLDVRRPSLGELNGELLTTAFIILAANVFPVVRIEDRPVNFGVLCIPKASVVVVAVLPCTGALDTRPPCVRPLSVPLVVVVLVVVVTMCLVGRFGEPTLLWFLTLFATVFLVVSVHILALGTLLFVNTFVPFVRWLLLRLPRWVGVQFI